MDARAMFFLRPRTQGRVGGAKRIGGVRKHKGFTLVEVIVVLVILAILAAIAIPALTGYIDKAQDKQYIAMARNYSVALHTVVDEAYANGDFSGAAAQVYLKNSGSIPNINRWYISSMSELYSVPKDANKVYAYRDRASALLGEEFPRPGKPGHWNFTLVALKPSDVTALTADGFWWTYFPEGDISGKPMIFVTYKMLPLYPTSDTWTAMETALNNAEYSPNAGYEVYHLTF
jgi:prepilin-type N-terminal cleavage/methylation domain-containing protein